MTKQYTSSAHWPEDPNKVRAMADALMVLAEDAIDHGVSNSGWRLLGQKLAQGDEGEVSLHLAAWSVTLQDRARAFRDPSAI